MYFPYGLYSVPSLSTKTWKSVFNDSPWTWVGGALNALGNFLTTSSGLSLLHWDKQLDANLGMKFLIAALFPWPGPAAHPAPSIVVLFRSLGVQYLLALLSPTAPSKSASVWEGWSLAVVSIISAARASVGSQHGLYWVQQRRGMETKAVQDEAEEVPGTPVF